MDARFLRSLTSTLYCGERGFEGGEDSKILHAPCRSLRANDSLEWQYRKQNLVHLDLKRSAVLDLEASEPTRGQHYIQTISKYVAAERRRHHPKVSRDPHASRPLRRVRDAWISTVLEPKIDVQGSRVRPLKNRCAETDHEVRHRKLVQAQKEPTFSRGEGDFDHGRARDAGAASVSVRGFGAREKRRPRPDRVGSRRSGEPVATKARHAQPMLVALASDRCAPLDYFCMCGSSQQANVPGGFSWGIAGHLAGLYSPGPADALSARNGAQPFGPSISSGRTNRLKSSDDTKPRASAACRRVRPSLWAFLAILAALS